MQLGAEVYLWGTRIGMVVQTDRAVPPSFTYDNNFVKSGIELSPVTMPLSLQTYSFPGLREESFRGLPGLLADSLPDKFGTHIIENYLAKQGRLEEGLSPIERLCYVGQRGMGALEYEPQIGMGIPDQSIDIDELAKLADEILTDRRNVSITADERAIEQLIKISTSAGGARAKALIAWNRETNHIRSGQVDAGDGYSYWLLKFGDMKNNRDKDTMADEYGYTQIEYAYSLMCRDAGIEMTECQLIKSREGMHFVTKRFDRDENTGRKIHMHTLGGLAHFDFNDPGANSYEQAAQVMRKIKLPQSDIEQLFRRMVFNEVAKNYDDHVKNISFLMDRAGVWKLAPAYDMTFSYRPDSVWTSRHQMRINGKRDQLTLDDLRACGRNMDISDRRIKDILKHVIGVVRHWERYAEYAGVSEQGMGNIKSCHKYLDDFRDYEAKLEYLERVRKECPQGFRQID
ncbi:MAG: type II toxin-antitoxin system HipA family toxin [Acetatifactor sp.]|nr:type II toxin-antitoxin system HipA family toxin [Acetatifactor sp.]